jgi:hypothetical protein
LEQVSVDLEALRQPAHAADEVTRKRLEPSLHLLGHRLLRLIQAQPFHQGALAESALGGIHALPDAQLRGEALEKTYAAEGLTHEVVNQLAVQVNVQRVGALPEDLG